MDAIVFFVRLSFAVFRRMVRVLILRLRTIVPTTAQEAASRTVLAFGLLHSFGFGPTIRIDGEC